MTKEHHIIRDKAELNRYVRERYGVSANLEAIEVGKDGVKAEVGGFCCLNGGSSAGPLIWITSRLREHNAFRPGCPVEADDFHCLCAEGGKLFVAPVARSKVFRTMLLPEPIDLTAAKVSVITYSDSWT